MNTLHRSLIALVVLAAVARVGAQPQADTTPAAPALAASTGPAAVAPSATQVERSTLAVSGSGVASSAPDRAIASLGVSSQKVTAAEAQSEVNAVLNRALEAIQALGIPRKSITTASINLYPIFENPRPGQGQEEPPRVLAYRASNTIRITLDDLAMIGKVIDACIKSGCNQLEGVNFELKDDSSQRRDALAAACVDAAAKAQTIASTLKLRIIGIQEIVESGVSTQPPIPMFRSLRGDMAMSAAPTPVEPGQVKVDAGVTVRYIVESLHPEMHRDHP